MVAMNTAANTAMTMVDPILVQSVSAEGAWALVAEVQREVETMQDHRDLAQEDLDAQRAQLRRLVAVATHVDGVALSEPMLTEDNPAWLGAEEEALGVKEATDEPDGDLRPALDDDEGDGDGDGDSNDGDGEDDEPYSADADDLAYAMQHQAMGIIGLAWGQTGLTIEIATTVAKVGKALETGIRWGETAAEAAQLLADSSKQLSTDALDMQRAIGAFEELYRNHYDAINGGEEHADEEEEQRQDEEFLRSRDREWFVGVRHSADGSASLHEAAESLRGFAEELDDARERGYELRQPVRDGAIVCLKTDDPMYHPVRLDAWGRAYIDHSNDISNEETDR